MFEGLKERLYKYRFKKLHRSGAAYPDWKNVKSVLLLFDSEQNQQNLQVKQLVKELRQDGKQVVAWGYTDSKEILPTTLPNFFVFGRNEVDFWGCPQQFEVMNHFIDKHFDVLLDLTLTDTLPMRYLSLLAPVSFRAGRQSEELPYRNDLMLVLPEGKDTAYFFDQLIYYFKQIKSNDQ